MSSDAEYEAGMAAATKAGQDGDQRNVIIKAVESPTPPPTPDDPAVDIAVTVWIGKRQLAAMEPPQAAALMASLQDLFIVIDRIGKIEKGEISA